VTACVACSTTLTVVGLMMSTIAIQWITTIDIPGLVGMSNTGALVSQHELPFA